ETTAASRHSLARDVARGALMGARGNSGVIFSQIVRGAANVLGETNGAGIDARATALALRGATDAAYRAVRRPVEGTMLSVIRELAEEAEQRAQEAPPLGDLLVELVRRGEAAVARTPVRLRAVVPDERATAGVVAVVAGDGNRRLFESLAAPVGPIAIVEGGQSMNPSTRDLVVAIESLPADEAIVLPNNSNVVLTAEQA